MKEEVKLRENRNLVELKVEDVLQQLSEIESLVGEQEMSPNDDNFVSDVFSIRQNLMSFLANWERGR